MGKRLQTRAAVACMKTLLMIFNVIFWLSGALMLAAGIVVKVEVYKYVEVSAEFSATAPYVLVATGGFMLLLGILACCCTAKGQPVLLYIYAAFLLVIFVIMIGAGVSTWAYRKHLKNSYEDGLTRAFTEYDRTPTMTSAVNNLQNVLRCCGIQNASDWVAMPYGQSHDPPYPPSCCREEQENFCIALHPQGCYSTVIHFLESSTGVILISALSFACFQFVGVILACCLARNINRAKYEQV
ncbi:tetraspanin-7-like [Penaeus japonicus]|uniref:tetraspanin-7-like n=1 Tax=Penaeus japonicus TaxID=27405 RepID=UPI001C70E0F5|nr:tetraspanin-7-like [Penaeus japonicus]